MKNLTQLLQEIGLKEIEAKIYLELIRNPETTGYKIADQINKPVANTYKALKFLEEKDLVSRLELSRRKIYSAKSINDFADNKLIKLQNTINSIKSEIKKMNKKEQKTQFTKFEKEDDIIKAVKSVIEKTKFVLIFRSSDYFRSKFENLINLKKRENILLKIQNKEHNLLLEDKYQYIELSSDNFSYLIAFYDNANNKVISGFYNDEKQLSQFYSNHMMQNLKETGEVKMLKEDYVKYPPRIEGERIFLENEIPLSEKDKTAFSNDELRIFYGFEDLKEWHNPIWEQNQNMILWRIRLKESSKLIGAIIIDDWNKKYGLAKLAYILCQDFQKQGFMSEAIESILKFSFEVLRLRVLSVQTHENNKPSITLLQKTGFIEKGETGEKDHCYWGKGKEKIFSIKSKDYLQK